MRVAQAAASDFVFVNLFRDPIGAPLRPDAVGELLAAASRRAGLDPAIRPHQLRHAFASNVADAGGGIDVVADLLGHTSITSSQVYVHPDPSRLRAAVDAVPSPREQAGTPR
jgi:integrase/recombinase XerD